VELPRPSLHLKSVLDRTEVHLGDIEIEPILSTPEHILQPNPTLVLSLYLRGFIPVPLYEYIMYLLLTVVSR
jgi:hypothetical protein